MNNNQKMEWVYGGTYIEQSRVLHIGEGWFAKLVKARVSHKCSYCGKLIKRGQFYMVFKSPRTKQTDIRWHRTSWMCDATGCLSVVG